MSAERPTFKDLYEAIERLEDKVEEKFPTKAEMRFTVALALIGGSAVSSVVASFITRSTPQQQLHAAAYLIAQFF